jgi:hypothetical protein
MEISKPVQKPAYELHQKLSKILIIKSVTLITLSVIFYVGIMIIVSLLNLPANQETGIQVGALMLLIILIGAGVLIDYKKGKKKYLFYAHSIVFGNKSVAYRAINNTNLKENFLDKMFKTYSIKLNEDLILINISKSLDMQTYLKQLIAYDKKSAPK